MKEKLIKYIEILKKRNEQTRLVIVDFKDEPDELVQAVLKNYIIKYKTRKRIIKELEELL